MVAATLFVTQASTQVVSIPDPNLRQVVIEALELPDGSPVTQQEMLRLTILEAEKRGITDLAALEHATNLGYLNLGGNPINDIRSLADLIHLTKLLPWDNQIRDIDPLTKLTNLIDRTYAFQHSWRGASPRGTFRFTRIPIESGRDRGCPAPINRDASTYSWLRKSYFNQLPKEGPFT